MWSQKSDSNMTGSNSGISRLGRPGSGRSERGGGAERNGPEQQYNAWDRAARPGSGRGAAGNRNSATSPGASVSSTSSPSLSPTSPSAGGGLVPEHRIRPLPGGLNLVPGRMCSTASCLTSPEQQERRQSLKISFSQPNIMKKSVSMGLGFPGFHQAAAASAKVASENKFQLYTSSNSTGRLKIDSCEFEFKAEDLLDLGEIGRGAFGTVNKMLFQKANKVMAVKRIRSTVDEREQKELMDLDVVMKSSDCHFIVAFYGAIFKEGDCWICMELMSTSLDKLYKFVHEYLNESIPEPILGQITLATLKALVYLKDQLKIIHRDVKPSNILSDRRGNIKLCDFGISGQLVDSIAKTRDAGCRPYMAPERIDPQRAKGYDIRSDVWSLGITLIEVSTGRFPYPKWNSVFEQLQQVVHGDPPNLDPRENGKSFTFEFVNFVNTCLIKDELQRPKYNRLLEHPFIRRSEAEANSVNVAEYINRIVDQWDTMPAQEGEGSFMDCSSPWATNG